MRAVKVEVDKIQRARLPGEANGRNFRSNGLVEQTGTVPRRCYTEAKPWQAHSTRVRMQHDAPKEDPAMARHLKTTRSALHLSHCRGSGGAARHCATLSRSTSMAFSFSLSCQSFSSTPDEQSKMHPQVLMMDMCAAITTASQRR